MKETIFTCDMCGEKIHPPEKHAEVSLSVHRADRSIPDSIVGYDLCLDCGEFIETAIKRGANGKEVAA